MGRRVLVLGANGQLGRDLLAAWPAMRPDDTVGGLTHADLEVTDAAAVQAALDAAAPDVVVNTTAYHRVDEVESRPEKGFAVNALAPLRLARACRAAGATLVHFSTDYVFSGRGRDTPYAESDAPEPLSVYATSKVAGEMLVRQTLESHFIVRSCGLYGVVGSAGKGGNFVETMLRLGASGGPVRVVDDQVVTPTPTWALAPQVVALVTGAEPGTYHATCAGQCTWFEFAREIFRQAGLAVDLSPQSSAALAAPARRPSYSVLANAALGRLGLDRMPDWREGLAGYFARRAGPPG